MDMIAFIHERMQGLFPSLLGVRLLEASKDGVKAVIEVRPDLCTSGEVLHGGAIMAFADTLGAVATVMNLPEGGGTTTIESKTNFFRPAPVGSQITGECTALHKGRKTMTWQTKLSNEEGKTVAIVTQTQFVFEPKG
jgi:uncharacterized protein (TIGR00369 family)